MSNDLPPLHQRREQILQEMGAIDQLCRGHLSEQFFKSKQGGRTVRRGPYYVLQRWFRGKNLCERVPADRAHVRIDDGEDRSRADDGVDCRPASAE